MSIPPREEWERMLENAERQAREILSKYEKKCKDIEVLTGLNEKCFSDI